MIAAIYKGGMGVKDLETMGEEQWEKIVSSVVEFATEVCLSYENYISKDFARKF